MSKNMRFSSIIQRVNAFCDVRLVAVGLGIVALTHCSSETQAGSSPLLGVYIQVDRVGRPGVKEIFENFTTHETTNRNSPQTDVAFPAAVQNYMIGDSSSDVQVAPNGTGGTSADATAVQAIFVPDELQANLSSTTTASQYLSIELGNTSAFGGRSIQDTAMESDLAAIYGGTVDSMSLGLSYGANACMVTDGLKAPVSPTAPNTFPFLI